ncbi:C-type lectin 37Da-like [Toxorhynchites rutilus septentrionalis]|uniref:C-type lectin 37Da-like n=1 Tax=Toxorhynchites rutilus septentrionalis TaxID=329112 RepID=UPI00247AC546|nr:C-type lectin 37Da-like [Toxorhynchites rutilus septentrionalis]
MIRNACIILQFGALLIGAQQLHCTPQSAHSYHIALYPSNWHEAVEYCNRLGLRLAIVDNAAKHEAIVQAAQATGLQSSGYFGLWLGASDLARTKTYVWQSTGERLVFGKWKPGEPTGGSEHCLHLSYWPSNGFNWTWNDARCDTNLYAVCETDESRCFR